MNKQIQSPDHALTATTAAVVLFVAMLSAPAIAGKDNYQANWHRSPHQLQVDVAEAATRFVFDDAPVFEEDGFPAHGNSFVTQGYIYPGGFLDDHEGVTEAGEPTYPERVIGEWICRGWFIGDGAHTQTGPWVISTQQLDFYKNAGWDPQRERDFGYRTLVTEGYELADIGKPIKRAISGGTGRYAQARGQVVQTLLGFGPGMAVKQRYQIKVRH